MLKDGRRPWPEPPLFNLNFRGVLVAPDRPSWGQPEQRP